MKKKIERKGMERDQQVQGRGIRQKGKRVERVWRERQRNGSGKKKEKEGVAEARGERV